MSVVIGIKTPTGIIMFRRILNAKPHLIHEARHGCPYATALLKHLDDMVVEINYNPKESP